MDLVNSALQLKLPDTCECCCCIFAENIEFWSKRYKITRKIPWRGQSPQINKDNNILQETIPQNKKSVGRMF